MPVRNDNPHQLIPHPGNPSAHRWELIMPMLLANKAEDKEANKGDGLFKGCWNGVKNIYTGIDPETGREFIAYTYCGVALIGGPFESQRVAFRTTCPKCGHDAANLPRYASPIQQCCRHCRLDHERAMARNAARRRRRANGEVTTPSVKACEVCGNDFEPKRSTARFCSSKCRVAAHRAAKQ